MLGIIRLGFDFKRFMKLKNFLIIVFVLAGFPLHAQIYKHIDKNGVVHYSNIRPKVNNYKIVNLKCRSCGWRRSVDWNRVPLYMEEFTPEILDACEKYAVDEAFVRAVIHAESSFKPKAVSDMGAQGLMQLMPATQKRFGVRSAFNPRQNIKGGVAYLRILLDLFDNDTELAAAAYNAGENAVKRNGGVPPYEETRNFVKRVETLRKRYRRSIAKLS